MRLRFFGGITLTTGAGDVEVRGRGQEALLLRLALDAGTTVSYRVLSEDVWPADPPADPRAALQSLASRLRRSLPEAWIEAVPGGYRLALDRASVDLTHFQDLVASARHETDAAAATALARDALTLWTGEPWLPDGFDWVARDLWEDRGHAERLARGADLSATVTTPSAASVPAALTPLVGRAPELAQIREQLATERLVTVVGPGGAGKTTLALETARHEENVVVVELAPVTAGEVWNALDGAIGRSVRIDTTTAPPPTPRERVLATLSGRAALIVLDNCEHVVAEAASIVTEVLRSTPAARVLATSREPLGVPGEAFVDLGPLADHDAIELFARRIRAARGTSPDAAEEETARRIIDRLDGLPLAIELAAAKTRTMSLPEIEAGLDDRFRLLRAPGRGGDGRHQTLRALIDWSWDTLGDGERDALKLIAVFPDGVGAEDAGHVAQAFDVGIDDLEALVDRSLTYRKHGRFRMLETVREYGLERLREEGGLAAAQASQAAVMALLATDRDPATRGPRAREAVRWFDANEDNLSAATRWAASTAEGTEIGLALTRAQLWVWLMRERFDEVQSTLDAFGAATTALDSEASVVIAAVGLTMAAIASADDDPDTIEERYAARAEEIVAAALRHPSDLTLALPTLLSRALTGLWRRRPTERQRFELPENLIPQAPLWTRALMALMRAALAQNESDLAALATQSERALTIFLEVGDPWGIAFASQLRAEWLQLNGRLSEALSVADAAVTDMTGLSSPTDVIQQRSQAIGILTRMGRFVKAEQRLADLELLARGTGSLAAHNQLAAVRGALELARQDAEAALAALPDVDTPLPPGYPQQLASWMLSHRAQALALLGRTDEAGNAARRAVAIAVNTHDSPIMAEAAVALAMWREASGDQDASRHALAVSDVLRGVHDSTNPTLQRLRERLSAVGEAAPPVAPAESPEAALLALLP